MWYKRKCKTCLEKYVPVQEIQKFCGAICRIEWWKKNSYSRRRSRTTNCLTCGEEFIKYNDNHKFCGPTCKPTFVEPKKKSNVEIKRNLFSDILKKVYKFYNRKPVPIKKRDQYELNERFDEITITGPGKKGAITEHEFMCHVARRGWECFQNFSPNGPIDLVIFKEKESYFIDAKTNPHSGLNADQKYLDIKIGYLDRHRNVAIISDSRGHVIKQI